jgi:uncharacterized membrane protein YvbJ
MAYCPKCGTKNDDDAVYCKNCGSSLGVSKPTTEHERHRDQRCEDECAGGKGGRGWAVFWGVIIILIGLAILFEVVLKGMASTYPSLAWVNTVQWGWIFAGVIALFIIIFGIRVISRH